MYKLSFIIFIFLISFLFDILSFLHLVHSYMGKGKMRESILLMGFVCPLHYAFPCFYFFCIYLYASTLPFVILFVSFIYYLAFLSCSIIFLHHIYYLLFCYFF